SAVAHGLRSIMAAPLMLRERFLGVIYLDSRVARGIFTEEDVAILRALGNYIAIAMESARAATLEVEKRELAKDLEITGAIQTLFIPHRDLIDEERFGLAASYQPATQSGGDWWWYEPAAQGARRIFVGDVTGHGAGAAMMTGTIASSYTTLQALAAGTDPKRVLEVMSEALRKISAGKYWMTMSALEMDPAAKSFQWWNAGGPPLFVLKRDGKVENHSETGAPLGSDDLKIGVARGSAESGDRFFLFTDGVFELQLASGQPLGMRKLTKLLAETAAMPLGPARKFLAEKLVALHDGRPQADDITFVLAEMS
ncbi:MAG: PP2C family protein-serine/threonine phosphatase, partial [Bdellovibrionota bacterium]